MVMCWYNVGESLVGRLLGRIETVTHFVALVVVDMKLKCQFSTSLHGGMNFSH